VATKNVPVNVIGPNTDNPFVYDGLDANGAIQSSAAPNSATTRSMGRPQDYGAVFSDFGWNYMEENFGITVPEDYRDLIRLQRNSVDPMYFILGEGQGDIAPNWFIRNGGDDTACLLPFVYNMAAALEAQGKNVDAQITWDQGHGLTNDMAGFFSFAEEAIADAAGDDANVTLAGDTAVMKGEAADFTVSVNNLDRLATVTVWVEADADYLEGRTFTGLNGFDVLGGVNWEKKDGSIWTGRITLVNLSGGVSSDSWLDILSLTFGSKDKLGESDVKLAKVLLSGFDEDSRAVYFEPRISNNLVGLTVIDYQSPYDVNGDGKTDQLDLTHAQLNFMAKEGDGNWDAAKGADINGDGVVDIEDLILILNNIVW
jgi:hypothetical protein